MADIYVIPDREHISQSVELIKECKGAFEYNDFWYSKILSDRKKQLAIIDWYSRFHSDFSEDTIHGAFLDVTIHSSDDLIREASMLRVKQSLDIAKEMGVKGIVFHTNLLYGFFEENYLNNWLSATEAFFRKMLDAYPDQEIYMENMFDSKPDMLLRLAEAMSDAPSFGVCLDYAHGVVFGDNPEEWVRQLSKYVKHMHINDNDLKNDQHLEIGKGKIDWKVFDEQMRKYNVNAPVLIETSGVEKQKASLNYMKEQMLYPWRGEKV